MARLTPCPWIKVSSANITNQIYFKLLRRKNLFQNVEKEKSISKCWERSVKRKTSLSLSRVKKFVFWSTLGDSRKNPNREGGGERGVRTSNFHRGIEERSCGNSRGQLKKKWNSQGCSRITHMEFPWTFWPWKFQGVSQILQCFQCESLFSPEFLKGISGKSEYSKRVFFSERYILKTSCLDFFWSSQFSIYMVQTFQKFFWWRFFFVPRSELLV